VINPGHTLTVVQSEGFAVKDGRETPCLRSLQTVMRLDRQPDDTRRALG
jgi:hypothetical protein